VPAKGDEVREYLEFAMEMRRRGADIGEWRGAKRRIDGLLIEVQGNGLAAARTRDCQPPRVRHAQNTVQASHMAEGARVTQTSEVASWNGLHSRE